MEQKKKIQTASLVDLKAELLKKQEELKQQKLSGNGIGFIRPKTSEKKNDIWSRKNKGVLERAQRDFEKKAEEENVFENSKRKLQEKAKMYDKITQGSHIPEEDGSKLYLVDFEKKVIDQMIDVREKDRERKKRDEEEEMRRKEEEILSKADIPPPASKDEEWVDYVDGFGRTRTCLRKDLKDHTERDRASAGARFTGPSAQNTLSDDKPTLMSDDMRRELQRQKWEEEAQANLNGPVHYSNVQFDEIRNHGTGFFQFSKTEEERQKEMETLGDLRQQTIDERARRERLKEKRKAMLDARLAKVKKRKQQEAGLFSSEKEEDANSEVPADDQKMPEKPAVEEPQLLTRDENINKNKPEREWDKGKESLFSYPNATTEEKYFQEKRDQRQSEFAPPSFYYSDTKKGTNDSAKRYQQNENRRSDFGLSSAFSDDKHMDTQNERNIPSSNEKSYKCVPPPFYPGGTAIGKSNYTSKTHNKINTSTTATSSHREKTDQGSCIHSSSIEEFLRRERNEVSKTRQCEDTQLNVESTTESLQVGDIPLPKPTNTASTSANNESFSTEVRSDNSVQRNSQYNISSGVTGYDLSADNQTLSGGFQFNPMAQFDSYGQPNLNVPPPNVFNPFPGSYSQPSHAGTEAQSTTSDLYTATPTIGQNTEYTNNHIQPSATIAQNPVTQNTERTTQVAIPKLSIVDTRLMKNESLETDEHDDSSVDEQVEETSSVSSSLQSNCDISVPTQSVFSSAPIRYAQNTSYETMEN
ncbi:coiled-coil domain-containing protein 174-like [Argopecten irradians]|uniref:coiled-coil domain-containing protein 174-like n=1 Tax=Argopecten irradians TaxID=31199 RepID=UPI003718BD04